MTNANTIARGWGRGLHTFMVCAYGESPYLEECIRSLVVQSDCGSIGIATSTPNDLIRGVASKYQLPLFVRNGISNIADDWNFAISQADTPLVTVAHQDDIYGRSYSKELLNAYGERPDMLIFFSNYGEIRNSGIIEKNHLLSVKRAMLSPLKDGHFSGSRFVRRRILSLGSAICCPSVSFNLNRLDQPIFRSEMKCDLDWQAWERISKLEGSFYYDSSVLVYHRIHEGSETTHLIGDNTRGREDFEMLKKFWPSPIARLVYRVYSLSQRSNG